MFSASNDYSIEVEKLAKKESFIQASVFQMKSELLRANNLLGKVRHSMDPCKCSKHIPRVLKFDCIVFLSNDLANSGSWMCRQTMKSSSKKIFG